MDDVQLRELCRLAPFENAADAELALFSSLETLGFLLPEHLVRKLEAVLPSACASSLASGRAASRASGGTADAYVPPPGSGQAVERIQVVCSALAKRLPAELVVDLMRELPAPLASAFAGGAAHWVPQAERVTRREGARHVSEATLGSAQSLAGGRPRGPQQDSVAAANPHGDTKLSSARGLTQEREGETLAGTSALRARRKERT
jgi:hypothetical protein